MKQTKKLLALLLALAMVFALAACGGGGQGSSETPAGGTESPAAGTESPAGGEETPSGEAVTDPDDINDNMTDPNGVYQVAFVTDVGQLRTSPSTRAPMTA